MIDFMSHPPSISTRRGFFLSVNENLQIVSIGRECITATTYEPMELLGKPLVDILDAGSVHVLTEAVHAAFQGKCVSVRCTFGAKSVMKVNLQLVLTGDTKSTRVKTVDLYVHGSWSEIPERNRIPRLITLHYPLPVILYEIAAALEAEFPDYAVSIAVELDEHEQIIHIETPRMPLRPAFHPGTRDTRLVLCHGAMARHGVFVSGNIGTYAECEDCHWLQIDYDKSTCWSQVLRSPEGISVGKFSIHGGKGTVPNVSILEILHLYAAMAELAIWSHHYEETYKWQSDHDDLTRLLNLHGLTENLQILTTSSEICAVFYLDLDNFEFINESLGHEAGNDVLRKLAARLDGWSNDLGFGVVGRVAGDEFTVVLPGIGENEALSLAYQLLTVIREPIALRDTATYVSASIGVAVGRDPQLLLQQAFRGSSEAKELGMDTACFYREERDSRTFKLFQLMRDIHSALEQNQLDLHYQPRVHPSTGQMIGAEALLRWNHPNLGLIYPGEFIEMLEKHGFMNSVCRWTMRRVCKDIETWKKLHLDVVPVSINFSPKQLLQPGMVDDIVNVVLVTGTDPSLIQVELTERIPTRRHDLMVGAVEKLRGYGIQVMIDDFVETSSPFSYLDNPFIYAIKIEKDVTDKIVASQHHRDILSALVDVAHKIGVKSIIEGVETAEQMNLLRELQCDELQGYLFSRPVAMRRFQELLAQKHLLAEDPSA